MLQKARHCSGFAQRKKIKRERERQRVHRDRIVHSKENGKNVVKALLKNRADQRELIGGIEINEMDYVK